MSMIFRQLEVNSISPKTLTKHKLVTSRRNPNTTSQILLLSSIQNCIITPAATISAGIDTIELYIVFHPAAKDRAGSTKCSASVKDQYSVRLDQT